MAREMAVLNIDQIVGRNPNGGAESSSTTVMPYQMKHTIFKVPVHSTDRNPEAYTPNVVAIGPYHHGESHLTNMEQHKQRALEHLLHRSRKSYQDFSNELRKLVQQLRQSYEQLDARWKDDDKFLRLMIRDGAFLYEYMRCLSKDTATSSNYHLHDPVFGYYAHLSVYASLIPDLLMVENQLPLQVLERLIAVEANRIDEKHFKKVYKFVLDLLGQTTTNSEEETPRGASSEETPHLHVLDVARQAITKDTSLSPDANKKPATQVLSASELSDAGLAFGESAVQGTRGITFDHHTLYLAPLYIDTFTEPLFLNSIAFEQLCPIVGRQVSSYIAFMSGLIRTPADVGLLRSQSLISSRIEGDDHVAKLISTISQNVFFDPYSNLCKVRDDLNTYHEARMKGLRPRLREWLRKLKQMYFDNPWTTISVIAATVLLVLTTLQTVYTILGYYTG